MSLSDAQLDRYARHVVLRELGGPGQKAFLAARVLVVGAGGLGSPLLLYLAAAGVGTLGIVDDDAVSLSNLQRQIAFGTPDIGAPKAARAADAVRRLNPDVTVDVHASRLTADNAAELVRRYDIVCDGSDNFATRFLINDVCFAAGRMLVSAAVTEFDGQLSVFKAHLRPGGKRVFPCYRCLFPEPPPPGTVASCTEAGVLGAAAGVMGALQAQETLKEIAGIGRSLAGRLLLYDALNAEFRTIGLKPDPACAVCAA